MSRVRSLLILIAGLAALTGTASAQNGPMDIVGLRLGMTEAEATAALRAHSSALKVQVVRSAYGYTDGVKQMSTPQFVSRIEGYLPSKVSQGPNFIVLLTPPPQGGRVWAVERRENAGGNPPTIDQYTQALVQKYGKPSGVSRNGAAMVWEQPAGRPNCLKKPSDAGFPQYRPSADRDPHSHLEYAQKTRRAPADLGQCAVTLNYVLGTSDGSVLGSFHALLLDVATYAKASAAASAEVRALEDAARKSRAGQAQLPKL